jgi:hypothetical protein
MARKIESISATFEVVIKHDVIYGTEKEILKLMEECLQRSGAIKIKLIDKKVVKK